MVSGDAVASRAVEVPIGAVASTAAAAANGSVASSAAVASLETAEAPGTLGLAGAPTSTAAGEPDARSSVRRLYPPSRTARLREGNVARQGSRAWGAAPAATQQSKNRKALPRRRSLGWPPSLMRPLKMKES
jgi:hypothetical protein